MSSKIFRAIWAAAVTVFLASLVFIMGISYSYFSSLQKRQLKSETDLASRGLALAGEAFFENLETENFRITWIGPDGDVLYDSEANSHRMENHLEREEVMEAIKTGYGESVRFSNTLADRELYAARRLPDGSVLRLSIVQMAVWTLVMGFAQPISLVILIALILSFVLASRLAKVIVKPINEIDLKHPEDYFGKEKYKEIEPLLIHISDQRIRLMQDQEEIEKMALVRQDFTANVSHELKTPLHVISGYAELLANGLVEEADIKPFAGKIYDESMRMTQLVEDIIDLTRLDNGGAEICWEDCDLVRIAENAVESLKTEAAGKEVALSVEGTSAPMRGIPQQLHSIVYNLCDNAIKYNRRGGSVTVSVTQNDRDTLLSVRDTGIGIPEESRKRIFERFYRVDKSRSKEAGGTGLGLSIVKHAVMIHKGTIIVNSTMGEGSEFIVILPDRPAAKKAA
ncbi:MAG: PAS domain-containing sensor histidine kinase [Lachnospiraceae bacterium]|nr:PAS domain-containing sensor histidine kinase [Lachnospiraceae bacterium]